MTIEGTIDAGNIDRVTDYIRQCSLVKNAVVLDLSGVTSFDPSAISMLYVLDDSCRAAGVEWALVPSLHVLDVLGSTGHETVFPLTHSAREALHNFADMISRRRELLLPLIKKTA
nr:STAS domain-containing protein [Mycobacterium botniense]